MSRDPAKSRPLSENVKRMESRICPGTFLADHKAVCFDLNRVKLA